MYTHTHTAQGDCHALISVLQTRKNALDGTNLFERVTGERGALQDNMRKCGVNDKPIIDTCLFKNELCKEKNAIKR